MRISLFELIVNYERARNFFFILVINNFLNFMALNEVENWKTAHV
jgi:hypothetical protein